MEYIKLVFVCIITTLQLKCKYIKLLFVCIITTLQLQCKYIKLLFVCIITILQLQCKLIFLSLSIRNVPYRDTCSSIPNVGVYISQLTRYVRGSSLYSDFL